MPAHQGQTAVGERFKSDGRRISCADFRANRLVDKLAAHRHERNVAAEKGKQLVKSIRSAAKTSLATLGMVTLMANNCELHMIDENGQEITSIFRDSISKPIKKGSVEKPCKEKAKAEKNQAEDALISSKEASKIKAAWNKRKLQSAKLKAKKRRVEPAVKQEEPIQPTYTS